jgi:hypothetical protein
MESSDNSKKGFFKHVFNFDNDSKSDVLNIIQYALLAIIPIVILNKFMAKYVPEADDKKGSLEILAEVVMQIIVMFLGLFMIHRVIVYVPTYSGMDYPEMNITYIILSVLMITLSLQTKLGEKVSILVDRLVELWDGKTKQISGAGGKQGNMRSNHSQQMSNQMNLGGIGNIPQVQSQQNEHVNMNQSAINQSLYGGSTSINQLPTANMNAPTQQIPNYNNMYQKDNTPLIDAATPGGAEGFYEPMAANSVLSGSFGSSW